MMPSIAHSSRFENLSFTQGTIQDFDSTNVIGALIEKLLLTVGLFNTNINQGTNILIALHACDTVPYNNSSHD
jgi:hypothetical protein